MVFSIVVSQSSHKPRHSLACHQVFAKGGISGAGVALVTSRYAFSKRIGEVQNGKT